SIACFAVKTWSAREQAISWIAVNRRCPICQKAAATIVIMPDQPTKSGLSRPGKTLLCLVEEVGPAAGATCTLPAPERGPHRLDGRRPAWRAVFRQAFPLRQCRELDIEATQRGPEDGIVTFQLDPHRVGG